MTGARRFFDNWKQGLKWQRLKPYEKFAEMIERHWDGAVARKARGKQVGRRLADAAIEMARLEGADSIVLETNTRLVAAASLYRKLGFVQVEAAGMQTSKYKRPSIWMKLDLPGKS